MANLIAAAVLSASLVITTSALPNVHVVGAADITGDGVTLAFGSVDIATGKTQWRGRAKLADGYSFCAGGFVQHDSSPSSALYYAVSTSAVVTYNVSDGAQLHSAPLSLPYDLVLGGLYTPPTTTSTAAGPLIWGVGSIGEGNFDVISINATTGKVEKVLVKYGSLGNCEGSSAASPGANSAAAVWFETDDGAGEGTDLLVRFDLAKKSYSPPVPHSGTISSVSSWVAQRRSSDGSLTAVLRDEPSFSTLPDAGLILATVNDTVYTELASVDAGTGAVTHLLMLNSSYSAAQGSFSCDISTGLAYAVLQGPHSLVTYSLATFNLTASPPTATYAHIPDSDNSKYGMFNPTLLH